MPPLASPRKGDQRKAEILGVARSLLVDEGYDRFVLREIAARTGMKLGNLQYYFSTRDVLLEAVVRKELQATFATMDANVSSGQDCESQLREIGRSLIREWSGASGRVYATLAFLAMHHESFHELHRDVYAQFYEHLMPVLQKLNPKANDIALLKTARLIAAVLDGAPFQLQSGTFATTPDSREHFVDDVCDHLVRIATT
jgi:AcrR family transcriptional regulator